MGSKITESTRAKILAELELMKTVTRLEVAEKIKEARSFGDLSENSEYDEAKNEQAKLESKIDEYEYLLSNCTIIKDSEVKTDVVDVGCLVTVFDQDFGEEEFTIVGSTEADPMLGKISDQSPIGVQLIGKKIGDIIKVETPNGTNEFKIMKIGLPK